MNSQVSPAPRLDSIQALRGIAALMVMIFHLSLKFDSVFGTHLQATTWLLQGGVDIFFLISGFVMAYSVRNLSGPSDAGAFMAKRYWRIAPLLYILTIIGIPIAISEHVPIDGARIANCFTILPLMHSNLKYQYALPAAWTLGYEMTFYLIVAAIVASRVRNRLAVLMAVCCLPAAVFPRMIEFSAGVGIYWLWSSNRVSLPKTSPRPLLWLGDMSYSLYLSHSLTFALLAPRLSHWSAVPMGLSLGIAGVLVGWFIYASVEAPLQRLGKGALDLRLFDQKPIRNDVVRS